VTGQGPGTWWGLVISGVIAAGFDEEQEQIAYLNSIFGTKLRRPGQPAGVQHSGSLRLLGQESERICLRIRAPGTRAYVGDPFVNLTYFGISDDRIPKN
jgi:hypothetical protein